MQEQAAEPRQGWVDVAGGRRLSYLVYGQPHVDLRQAAHVLLFMHGVPSSASEAASLGKAAAAAGVTVVSVDRPGLGQSSPHGGMSLASFAADLATLLDQLGLQRVALAGESGGGPYAAAAAAILGPSRVSQLHLLAALGPMHAGLALPGGIDKTTMRLLRWRMRPMAWLMHRPVKWLAEHKPAAIVRGAGDELGPADRELLAARPDLGDMVVGMMAGAYRQGVAGVLDDYRALAAPWTGFDVAQIGCPTTVWHGTLDACVPSAHAEWYAANIPRSELRLLEGEGHLTLSARRGHDIMAAVAGSSAAQPAA